MFSSKPKFDANKCKVNLKMLQNRFALLQQKKTNLAKQQKRQVAMMLKDDKEAQARILVEHIIREDYTLESYELLRQYADLILARLNVVTNEPELKPEVAEAVCSLLYAGWLMASEVPELGTLNQLFTAKYGKPYAAEVIENKEKYLNYRLLRMLTSTQVPDPTVVELYLTEIAKAYGVDWTPRPSAIPQPISSTIGVPLPPPGADAAGRRRPTWAARCRAILDAGGGGAGGGGGGRAGAADGDDPQAADVSALYGLQPAQPAATQPLAATLMKHPWGFGIVLDGDNVVTRLKEGSEAATTGQIAVGDRVLAVNGIAVSRDYPVKSVAIDLPDGAAATFSLERGAIPTAPVPFANAGEATMLPPMPAASASTLTGGLPPVPPLPRRRPRCRRTRARTTSWRGGSRR